MHDFVMMFAIENVYSILLLLCFSVYLCGSSTHHNTSLSFPFVYSICSPCVLCRNVWPVHQNLSISKGLITAAPSLTRKICPVVCTQCRDILDTWKVYRRSYGNYTRAQICTVVEHDFCSVFYVHVSETVIEGFIKDGPNFKGMYFIVQLQRSLRRCNT